MMNIRHLSAAGVIALFMAATAHADVGAYFGATAGLMNPDATGHDNAFNAGGVFGYRFFDALNGSGSIEAVATTTLKDGNTDGGGDWHLSTVGLYFAYRTTGEVYLKAKGGFAQQSIGGTGSVPEGTRLSFGFGGGWQATPKAAVELEYTLLRDVDFLSIGFNSRF